MGKESSPLKGYSVRLALPVLVACLILGLALAACGSSSSSSSSATTSSGSSGSSSSGEEAGGAGEEASSSGEEGSTSLAALEKTVKKFETEPTGIIQPSVGLGKFKVKPGGSIYNISCNVAIVACSQVTKYIKHASEAIGYTYHLCNTGANPEGPNECFTQAINAKPTAIVANAVGAEVASAGYAAAKKAGITTIGVFNPDPADGSVATVETGAEGCKEQGEILADAVTVAAEGEPNVLYAGEKSGGCDVGRQEGFETQYNSACSECAFEALQFDIGTVQNTLPQQLQASLNSEPNLNWIVGTFDEAASIAVTQIQQAGKQESMSVAGMDGNPANVQLMLNEEVQKYDLSFDLAAVAWGGVDAAARVYSGQKVPPGVPAQQYLLTWNNVGSLGPSKTWEGPPNYEREFEELWEH
jgi:ABC-type sugar transport system substrate-binding protein